MDMEFTRCEPCYDRLSLALVLDRSSMKERILIGEELAILRRSLEARQTSCFAT